MLVTKVNGQPVTNLQQYINLIAQIGSGQQVEHGLPGRHA